MKWCALTVPWLGFLAVRQEYSSSAFTSYRTYMIFLVPEWDGTQAASALVSAYSHKGSQWCLLCRTGATNFAKDSSDPPDPTEFLMWVGDTESEMQDGMWLLKRLLKRRTWRGSRKQKAQAGFRAAQVAGLQPAHSQALLHCAGCDTGHTTFPGPPHPQPHSIPRLTASLGLLLPNAKEISMASQTGVQQSPGWESQVNCLRAANNLGDRYSPFFF